MVLTYVCTRECYSGKLGLRIPGDRVIMDSAEGDAHPWFERDPELSVEQMDMQGPYSNEDQDEGEATHPADCVAEPGSFTVEECAMGKCGKGSKPKGSSKPTSGKGGKTKGKC